ncbi:Ig-like domain repeat protein [Bradyrhizobium sp. Ec3.3]|uniref:autotransporter family protein n=1 Tax=Bradyrhizobium sp. Ec3.3 TaxID=189753 RepID=UPI0018DE73D2|nr:Ig-like domain repeat protein [Bradyrhizobium sp. Ec3.3]
MISFDLDKIARRGHIRFGYTWLAAVLAAFSFFAIDGTAHAQRILPSGTVGTAYSQSVTVYTDALSCTPQPSNFTFPGLTPVQSGTSPTCAFTLTGTPTAAGTYTAAYNFVDGTDTYPADAAGFSVFYQITINKASPTLSLSPSSSSVVYGNALTLTATLANGVSTSGTVTFFDGSTAIGSASVSGSSASLSITLSVGSHTITASYGGDSNHNAASTTSTTSVTVVQATPSIALNASSSSASYGASVALVATMSGGVTPSGTVSFYEGSTQLGNATISGSTAILMLSSLSLGSHTITATYDGDTNNASVNSSSVTVAVGQDTPTVTLTASSTAMAPSTSVTLIATISSGRSPTGSVTFYDGSTSLGTVTVSGSAAILFVSSLSGGLHAFRAVYGGDSNNTTAISSTVSLSVGSATPTISVSSSTTSPAAAQSVTLTATLSGGSSPTGTVTFKDGTTVLGTATVSGAIATLATPALAMGTHAITATYGGDGNNAGATSSAITLTVGRSDPTASSTVRGLIGSQVSSAVQFGQTQISNIFSRFEALHDEDDGGGASGLAGASGSSQVGSGANGNTASGGGAGRTASSLDSQASAGPALGYASELLLGTSLTKQSDEGRAVNQFAAMLPQAVESLNKTNVLPFHVWASGTVGFGRLRSDDSFDNRFTSSGVTLGFDRRIADGLKLGAAFGLGFDHSDIGSDGSRIDARNFDAAIYASWRFRPHTYLDVAGGYGTLRFDSKRWSGDGNVMLAGARTGRDVFGTVGVTHVSKWDGWKISSYGRLDIVRAALDGYSETGSSTWALTYDSMNTTSVASVIGGRLAYPMLQSWGVLTPTARAEWRHAFDGGYAQTLNYVDLVGLASGYTLSGTSTSRDTLTGGLGLRAGVGGALSLDLEYLLTSSVSGIESQRVRGAVKYGF